MQSISNVFKEYLRRRNRDWLIKVNIAGQEYGSETIVDFSVETSVSTGEELEIGTANISKLTLRLKNTVTVPPNARVVPYVALNLPDEYEGNAGVAWQDNEDTWATADYLWNGAMTEWLPMGEFFVDTREIVQGHILELTCLDRMRFADIAYVSSLTYPTSMRAVWDEVCERAGLTYGNSVQINSSYRIEAGPAGYTCRQVLGYIAAAHGACVYVDRWGIVQWRKFSATDKPVDTFTKADYGRVKETGPTKTYTRIVVVYNPDDGLVFEAGSGDEAHTLYIENPFATPQMVQNLYAQLNGFSYAPVDMDVRGYPQFDAGDRIRYGTPAEELTWNAAGVAWQDADITWDGFEGSQPQGITLLLNVRYTFKGGLRMEFEAPARSEQQSEFRIEGSLTQQINRLRATTVREGRSYYGLTITRQRGLEIEREDHKSKITLNSDVQRWEVDGVPKLEYDAQANKLKFTGDIIMEGGSISWSNVNAPTPQDVGAVPNDDGRLSKLSSIGDYLGQLAEGQVSGLTGKLTYIGPTGIYTGTIGTDQLIAGSALIGSALIDSIKANQIVVGDNGEKIGDGLIASAANWNGKTTLLTPTGIYTGTVRATQIVVGDNGEKIGDNLIASAANWNGKTTLLTPTGIYTGTITTNQIVAGTAKIRAALIEDLVVGSNVIMGPNASLSWAQITNRPTIPQTAEDVGALPLNSPRLTYIGPTGIYTGTIQANQINAASLSAISANLGTVTAGTISGVTISGATIVSGFITGANITGGTIQTAGSGTYPRIELSASNSWLSFEATSTSYLRIQPLGSLVAFNMANGSSTFNINKATGGTTIQASDNITINNSGASIVMSGNHIFINAPNGTINLNAVGVYVNGNPI